MNKETRKKSKKTIRKMMDKVIKKRMEDEPFNENAIKNKNPFGYYLVPIEIWKASKFERSFVTSLGQSTFEKLAKIIAEGTGAEVENQHSEDFELNTYRDEKILEILMDQRKSKREPDWSSEIQEIHELKNQRYVTHNIISDLYIKRKDGTEEYYSIKTVKPNLDQTEKAKNDMLTIMASKENAEVYFALPYNPAGEGKDYKKAHKIPYKLFNMNSDKSVLIGSEFWNKIGEDENTYNELIDLFEEVGLEYSDEIRTDYLGL